MSDATDATPERSRSAAKDGTEARSLVAGLLIAGAAVAAAAAANAYIFYKTPPLTSRLPGGEVRYFPTPDGDIFYKKAGDGPPLLLLHSIGAGCSSYEFRNIFAALAERHTVYAVDLLGFGKSDKPAIVYTQETYLRQIADFARQVIGAGEGGRSVDVIATSLAAAYAVAVAQSEPALFGRLVLISPTGIDILATPPPAAADLLQRLLTAPVIGPTLYNLIASKKYIRSYLAQRVYADPKRATDEVVGVYHTAAHQPGGDNALPSFLTGLLNIDITDALRALPGERLLIVRGSAADETTAGRAAAFSGVNPGVRIERIENAGALPHEEQPEAFLSAVQPFLGTPVAAG